MSNLPKQDLRRVLIASVIGATIEWYDFFLYGVVAGHCSEQALFPQQRSAGFDPAGLRDLCRRIHRAAARWGGVRPISVTGSAENPCSC